jgi:ferredoxin-NADP reductase
MTSLTAPQLLLWIAAGILLQGAVAIGFALRRWHSAEAARGLVPAAEAAVRPDAAWAGWREFRVERREFEDAARSQCSFYLVPVDGTRLPAFKPGQFLTFALPVDEGGGGRRTITRCYSLSDRPDPKHYRITVKRVGAPADRPDLPPGLSSNHLHHQVQAGTLLKVKAPAGHFFIDADPALPAVLIAGGIGITPMMSMLRWCLDEQPGRALHLYYGVRDGRECAFRPVLEDLAARHPVFRLHLVFSRPQPGEAQGRDYHHEGRIGVDLLRATLPHGRHAFYVCGPPAFMQELVPALAAWGVPIADLHFEAFGPASVQLPGAPPPAAALGEGAAFEVHFARSGRTLAWDGRDASLLDFAERHGVEVESGCRSGSCGACQTRLVEGRVSYAQTPDHDIAPGHCLLCVGRPAASLVLEA